MVLLSYFLFFLRFSAGFLACKSWDISRIEEGQDYKVFVIFPLGLKQDTLRLMGTRELIMVSVLARHIFYFSLVIQVFN